MEENKEESQGHLFQFDKNSKKQSSKGANRLKNRRNQYLNNKEPEAMADSMKRNRDEKNVALRKEAKKNKFAKRRNYGVQSQTDQATTKSEIDQERYTVEQAQSAWDENMELMDYFQILSKTDYQIPHFLLLIECI